MTARSFIVLIAALALGSGAIAAQGATPRGGTAFVELNRIFQEDPEAKAGTEEARAQRTQKRNELRDRAKRLADLQSEQEKFAAGSEDFFRIQGEIERLNQTLKLRERIIGVEYDLAVVNLIRSTYSRAKAAAEAVAKESGFDAVAIYASGDLNASTYRDALGEVLTRSYLWTDPARDITERVLAAMKR